MSGSKPAGGVLSSAERCNIAAALESIVDLIEGWMVSGRYDEELPERGELRLDVEALPIRLIGTLVTG